VIEIHRAYVGELAAAEGEQLARESFGALGGVSNRARVVPSGIPLRQAFDQEVRVAFDDHKEVVEVVGDAACQLPDGLEALRRADLALEAVAVGDIDHAQDHIVSLDQGGRNMEREQDIELSSPERLDVDLLLKGSRPAHEGVKHVEPG